MTDLFLKFESAEQAKTFLYDVTIEHRDAAGTIVPPIVNTQTQEVTYPEGTVEVEVLKNKYTNTDVIGDIWKDTGTTQEIDGPEGTKITVPVMEKLAGYHVNIRAVQEDINPLQPFAVVPQNPVRIWA